ncbi:unnamed protein product [Pleuronectes platessa]|uniref:Uncharacterized protein n=1 Tax=Pleuronectes platessa TaxID=8262 RepID=A0A9N7V5M5_PLEPL|nr:unnamed protein product [Pleuronectes platessa]
MTNGGGENDGARGRRDRYREKKKKKKKEERLPTMPLHTCSRLSSNTNCRLFLSCSSADLICSPSIPSYSVSPALSQSLLPPSLLPSLPPPRLLFPRLWSVTAPQLVNMTLFKVFARRLT